MNLWKWIAIILAVMIILWFAFPSLFNTALKIIKQNSNASNNLIQSIKIRANESTKINITLPQINIQKTNKSGE